MTEIGVEEAQRSRGERNYFGEATMMSRRSRREILEPTALVMLAQIDGIGPTIFDFLGYWAEIIEKQGLKLWGRKGKEYLIGAVAELDSYESLNYCDGCDGYFMPRINDNLINEFLRYWRDLSSSGGDLLTLDDIVRCSACGGALDEYHKIIFNELHVYHEFLPDGKTVRHRENVTIQYQGGLNAYEGAPVLKGYEVTHSWGRGGTWTVSQISPGFHIDLSRSSRRYEPGKIQYKVQFDQPLAEGEKTSYTIQLEHQSEQAAIPTTFAVEVDYPIRTFTLNIVLPAHFDSAQPRLFEFKSSVDKQPISFHQLQWDVSTRTISWGFSGLKTSGRYLVEWGSFG